MSNTRKNGSAFSCLRGIFKSTIYQNDLYSLHASVRGHLLLAELTLLHKLLETLGAEFCLPSHPPMSTEKLAHALHRHTLRLRSPKTEDDNTTAADESPENVRSPHVKADEHVRRHPHDCKLEEPVQRHAGSVTDAADPRREHFRSVQVLESAQADGPSDRVDEDRRDRSIRSGFVARDAGLVRHVDGHVDVCSKLQKETGQEAAPASDDVDQAPGENHGEDELDDAVRAGRDQRAGFSVDAGVLEDFGDVL